MADRGHLDTSSFPLEGDVLDERIAAIAQAYLGEHALSPDAQRVLAVLATPGGATIARMELWEGSDTGPDEATLSDLSGFLVEVVAAALADHSISPSEHESIRRLKHLCYIAEGDFLRLQRRALIELLAAEMGLIMYDKEVDAREAVHEVDLQTAFDLSYDQWLDLTDEYIRPIVQSYIDKVMADGIATVEEQEGVLRKLASLNTVMKVDLSTMTLLSGESGVGRAETAPGRGIPNAVKDAVWRRDSGRCTQCGSQTALEFDHVIPFSRGGASTYRNVQLLCQSCNRAKSARIGETAI